MLCLPLQGKAGIVAVKTDKPVPTNSISGSERDSYLNKRVKEMYEALHDKYGYSEEKWDNLSFNEKVSMLLGYIQMKLLVDSNGESKVSEYDLLFESVDNTTEDMEINNIKENFFDKTKGLSFETTTKTQKDVGVGVYGMPLGYDHMSGDKETNTSVATDENGKKYIYTINEMPDYTEEILIEPTDEPEMYNAKVITKAVSSVNNRKNHYLNPNKVHQMTTIREGTYHMQDKYLNDYIGNLSNGLLESDTPTTIYHRVSTYTIDDDNLGQGAITTDETHNGEVIKKENNYTY